MRLTKETIRVLLANPMIDSKLRKPAQLNVLDVGCFDGHATKGLAQALVGKYRRTHILGIDTLDVSHTETLRGWGRLATTELRGNMRLLWQMDMDILKGEFPDGFNLITIMNPSPPQDISKMAIQLLMGRIPKQQFLESLKRYGITIPSGAYSEEELTAAAQTVFFDLMIPLLPQILAPEGILVVTCEPRMIPTEHARRKISGQLHMIADTPGRWEDERGFHSHIFAAAK